MTSIRPPPELGWIVDAVGEEAALRVVEAYGGQRIHIPHRVNQASALARAAGLEAARALSAELGGNRVTVPLAKRWRAQMMRARRGASYSEIARALCVAESTVYRWLDAGGMTAQQQGSLPGF